MKFGGLLPKTEIFPNPVKPPLLVRDRLIEHAELLKWETLLGSNEPKTAGEE